MPNSGSLLVCITRTLRDPRANYQPMDENLSDEDSSNGQQIKGSFQALGVRLERILKCATTYVFRRVSLCEEFFDNFLGIPLELARNTSTLSLEAPRSGFHAELTWNLQENSLWLVTSSSVNTRVPRGKEFNPGTRWRHRGICEDLILRGTHWNLQKLATSRCARVP